MRRDIAATRIFGALLVGGVATASGCYSGLEVQASPHDGLGDSEGGSEPADEGPEDGTTDEAEDSAGVAARVGANGLRRLTAHEYRRTVADLLGVDVDAELSLPDDPRVPFDNDAIQQHPSPALVDGARSLAESLAAEVIASPSLRDAVVGCVPTGPADGDCFASFIASFGRKTMRRPLSPGEAERFTALLAEAEESGNFYGAVDVALRTFLQHPRFLYRVEQGQPVQGVDDVYRLDAFEIATRLSYLIVGSTPSDDLLDRAQAGELQTPEDVVAAAQDLLELPEALDQVARFHALWLDYEKLSHEPALAEAMEAETRALIERVIFERNEPWSTLLTAKETFVTPALAEHYGLTVPADAQWVGYEGTERAGLLSHGSFLSAVPTVADTSPTKRGLLIQERLLCTVFPLPEDADTDLPEQPAGTCKVEHLQDSHLDPSCAACHNRFDPIGFGLERYDRRGAYRTTELEAPDCAVKGEGIVLRGDEEIPFSGPGELGAVLKGDARLDACVAQYLYRFAIGRSELDPQDRKLVSALTEDIPAGEMSLADIILDYVGNEAFLYRRDDPESGV